MNRLNITLASGIYPPDIGGPATFALALRTELMSKGHAVKVVTYSDLASSTEKDISRISRDKSIFFRYWQYFRLVLDSAKNNDVIYCFDLVSAGLPCVLVKILIPKIRLVLRLGGDMQWERALQAGRYDNTLRQYYTDKNFTIYEKLLYCLNNFVLNRADFIIFNANLLKDIYVKYRGVNTDKTVVIKNIAPQIEISSKENRFKNSKNILFAGRLVAFKNLKRLIDAFLIAKNDVAMKNVELEIIGAGPEKQKLADYLRQKDKENHVILLPKLERFRLLEKINNSDVVANVSLTEVNANFVSEAMALNKLIVLSKESESYFVKDDNNNIHYINPLDVNDIANTIVGVIKKADKNIFSPIKKSEVNSTIGEVVSQHLQVFQKVINNK